MDDVKTAESLALVDAVLRWTDPALLRAVQAAERSYIPHHLHEFYRMTKGFRFQILADAEVREPDREGWMGGPSYEVLIAAWNGLESNFRQCVSTDVYLSGVQMAPSPETVPKPIPQAWASDAKFDLKRGVIEVAGRRYASVRVSRNPPLTETCQEAAAAALVRREAGPASRQPITADNIAELSDDEILLLLEEHAKRVISSPGAKLIAPGKITLIPIIRRKLVARADAGDIMTTKGAECRYLARWIAEKVEHFATPKEGTISKMLGKDYELEKARANAAIQKSNI